MKLRVTPAAIAWFEEEWGLEKGKHVRFFARYGGSSTVQDGFSLGVAVEEPRDAALGTEVNGILFYVEKDDIWYLNEKNMTVDFDAKKNEIMYDFS
ncbi:HesB/YadR/YfhF family protein [Brevibacillus fluminis]|uniref:HesB/YadR/YfhF family protein n=1 Tax=Brevibacillus fluminis TaxID=511487 RepID=UPI003F8C9383